MLRSVVTCALLAATLTLTPFAGWAEAAVQAEAGPSPALFQDLHWRSIGPFRGGRVLAVAGAPDDPRRFYFGAVNGGVWRTDDAGRTWTPIFDGQPVGSIGALAIAPSRPQVIYVGSGEADMRSDIAQGVGMFRTSDGGATWARIGLADTQAIARILVDPRNPDVVLTAALGHPYGPNAERGVFRSTDGGQTWTKTLFKDADTGAIDLAFEPGNPDVVYAALWQTRRPPWNVYPPSNGPAGGLWKSVDGGRTWAQLTGHGLPARTGRIGLATTPANPGRVFALIDGAPETGGLYRSDDHGANWTKVSSDPRIWQRGWYFCTLTADPKNADLVRVMNTVVMRSNDGGATFVPVKGDPTGDDYHALWIDPANSDRRILGVDQGALVTLNDGKTWSSWFNQPTAQFYHVATDNRFPYWVYGAQQDSGAAGVPSRTDNPVDGINMTHFREMAAGGESDEIAPDPDDPNTVYGGRVDKLDLKSGQTRNIDPTLAYPDAYRGEWTLPLVFGKRSHDLYFGNQRIFRTSDGGEHWTPISPDLTRTSLTVPANLDPVTAQDSQEKGPRRGVVYDIGPSSVADGLIWAGTDDGLVWRTLDGGAHWQDVTPAGLKPWSKIGTVEPSHFDRDTAWLAVDRHRLDDFVPYIYRTRDGGRSWALVTAGIAEGGVLNAVNVVREDPAHRGLLYAGTERGIFVSFDAGDHWQALQQDLPRTSVRDITIHDADLVIATHGRGFYIMDDITPLRALADRADAATRLLPVAPAVRLHPPEFVGTFMPKDEPMAPNPPAGAYIDYIIGPDAAGRAVTLTVLDPKGDRVAAFSSTDPVTKPDPASLPAPAEWFPVYHPPAATPGQHRFVWNLHYPAPHLPPGETGPQAGVWAPPGAYRVELKVGTVSQSQPLEVRIDPRIKATPADLEAQFRLERRIEAARLQVQAALDEAEKEVARTLNPDQKVLMAAAQARLGEVAMRLAKLHQAVASADAAPSPDAVTGFDKAAVALDEALGQWRAARPVAAAAR